MLKGTLVLLRNPVWPIAINWNLSDMCRLVPGFNVIHT